MSAERETALHDCTAQAGKMSQHTWGDHRSCMMQHSQQE